MKHNRKSVVTLILAVMMIAAMAVSALADVGTKIAITNNESGNTFSIYKVMSAEEVGKDNSGKALYAYKVTPAFADFFTNNQDGYTLNAQNEILKGSTVIATDGRDTNTNTTEAAKLASALEKYAKQNNISAAATTNDKAGVDNLELGYYLVAQTASANVNDKEVASKPILVDLVNGNAEIAAKNDTTDLEKVIVENGNDVKANNVNIGDTVNYKITTKIPSYEANVDKTKLTFILTDTFSAGLTYQNDLAISGFEKDTDYTAVYDENTRKLTITFTADSIYKNQGAAVVATYSAVLNENAVVDSTAGNPNTVELKYTNNPNEENSFKTLEDETKTYTYGFKLHKVDKVAPSENLGDAEFTLQNSEGKYAQFTVSEDKKTYTLTGYTDNEEEATKIVSVEAAQVEIKGLDTGKYTLTETKAPDSYTKLAESVTVTITDQGEQTSDDHTPNGIGQITAGGGGSARPEAGAGATEIKDEDGHVTGAVENNNGSIDLAVFVENAKGINLPETGATSALVCMIGGAAIVLIGLLYYVFAARRSKKVRR